jgi:hypothetical protein
MSPLGAQRANSFSVTPKAGRTSRRAASKWSGPIATWVGSLGFVTFAGSTFSLSAKEVAALTRPSISAPVKFFVRFASSPRST